MLSCRTPMRAPLLDGVIFTPFETGTPLTAGWNDSSACPPLGRTTTVILFSLNESAETRAAYDACR